MYWCFTVKIYVMRKLCLILTVLYAFGANCSAQSSLNIAENLLEGNSSTFNSGWGNWEEQGDHCGRSLNSTGGPDGSQCAKLTSSGVTYDHDAQLRYAFPATEGTTYVLRLKAKKLSGSGTIKAIMQHNSGNYEQIPFFNPNATDSWATYEGEVKANRGDYNVIMINYGNCGEVLIDDIEFGVKTNNVAPTFTKNLKTSYTVGQNGKLTLSVKASGTPAPTYQWYKNTTTNSTEGATSIEGATTASYSVPTTTQGTTYYYCVATNGQGSATSDIAGVTVTTSLTPVLLYDFNDATDVSSIAYPNHDFTYQDWRKEHLYIDIIQDPYSDGKCLSVSDGNHKSDELLIIDFESKGVDFRGYGILAFDINFQQEERDVETDLVLHESFNYKNVEITLECKKTDGTPVDVPLQTFRTPVFPAPVWDTKLIPLTKKTEGGETVSVIPAGTTPVKLKIGPLNSMRCVYLIDNIRIKENVDDVEDYKQDDDLSDIWWNYEDETLYIKGTGPIPAYKGDKKCPWATSPNDRTPYIKHVIVSEGITAIGDYSVGNSQKDDVDITLHSIPEYFGEKCLKREYSETLTRTLHLQLWDEEKPFIAKTYSEYFPKFDTAKYFRNVKNTYSTVCLPFPVAAQTVKDAGVELFDFTSIKKDGDQYTLEFSKHIDEMGNEMGMVAGQTYLVKKRNIEGSLQNTDVEKDDFILTPSVSTKTVENSSPAFSISMTGVFQPSVFGPNLGTEDAPEYAYGFLNEKFYKNGGNMSVRPMRGYFYGSELYSAPVNGGANQMPKMFNFMILEDSTTGVAPTDITEEDFNIKEVYNANGMKTDSLSKGLNIIRTSTGKVMKIMVK